MSPSFEDRHPVVDLALDLQHELPNVAALDLLDHAMRDHRGTHLSFRNAGPTAALYADHRVPPFAELLRRAFAPQLDPRELALIGLVAQTEIPPDLQPRIQAAQQHWQRVIDSFAARYDLWNAKAA